MDAELWAGLEAVLPDNGENHWCDERWRFWPDRRLVLLIRDLRVELEGRSRKIAAEADALAAYVDELEAAGREDGA